MRRCRHVGASSWMLATAGTLAVLAVLRLDMPAATAERSCPDGEGGCGSAAASSRLRRLAAVGDGFLAGAGSGGLVGQGAPGQVDSPAALVARQAHVAATSSGEKPSFFGADAVSSDSPSTCPPRTPPPPISMNMHRG